MPTIFSHTIFAVVTGKAFIKKKVSFWFWLLTAVSAMIPDADVISFAFGIRYGSMFGHRGFTHSIVFAVFFGSIAALFVHKYLQTGLTLTKLAVYFSLITFSHTFFDMLTDGGLGVALFAPFSGERYFLPWQPIEVSPIGLRFFSASGLDVIFSEMILVWLPAFAIFGLTRIIYKIKAGRKLKPVHKSETLRNK
jgi:inner membrane protein